MLHVLLVDEDPALRTLLGAVLREDGHAIQEASDEVEALACLRASPVPLIVLLDWQMPRLDGFGVLRAVAADPLLAAGHRCILVTATDLQGDPERLTVLAHLQVPVIRKPFDIETIREAVAQAGTGQAAAAAA